MHTLSAALIFSLPIVVVFAGQSSHGSHYYHARHAARSAHVRATNTTYKLTDLHQGANFFDGWNFFTGSDPTHGNVQFVSQQDAQSKGLTTTSGNTTTIKVDDTSTVAKGGNRNSVRISSKKSYSSGLFIADFGAMPTGCGIWPAWWSAGPNWPNAGEIDVVEGVNKQTTNQYTLHTGAGNGSCTISKTNSAVKAFTANVLGTDCTSSQTSNAGCAFGDSDPTSFGEGFNNVSGGVFAHQWDSTGIKIWHFQRSNIPSDITAKAPNPASWPTPQAAWSSNDCDLSSHLFDHALTLDTTICGDWAGSAFSASGSGCSGTCSDIVADPTNFANAAWKVNYIAVYQ